jgi:hypothetical protein
VENFSDAAVPSPREKAPDASRRHCHIASWQCKFPLRAEHLQEHQDAIPRSHSSEQAESSSKRAAANAQAVSKTEARVRLWLLWQDDKATMLATPKSGDIAIRHFRRPFPVHHE